MLHMETTIYLSHVHGRYLYAYPAAGAMAGDNVAATCRL
jgi:hypothetical protein